MRKIEKLGDAFVFLSDLDGELADKYAGQTEGTFNAATYVIDKDGKIVYRHNDGDFKSRPPAEELISALRKLTD